MNPTTHRIRRHVLDIHADGTGDGLRLKSEAERWQRDVWLPMLERALDQYSNEDETIILDRLDVELNNLSANSWQEEAAGEIEQKLEEALRKQLSTTNGRSQPTVGRGIDALAHYLRTGTLPWWSPDAFKASPGDWIRKWARETDANTLDDAVRPLLSSTNARIRLAAELSGQPFWKLVRALSDDRDSKLWRQEYDLCIDLLKGARQAADSFCISCRAAVLGAVLYMRNPEKAAAHLAKELIPLISPEARSVLNEHLDALVKSGISKPAEFQNDVQEKNQPLELLLSPDAFAFADEAVEEEVRDEVHTHYISDAGLVILSPFLPRFFERLGIAKGGELTDKAKAAVLMHFLVRGETDYHEWQLLFPKILCGLPVQTLIPSGAVVLSQEEKDEAERLLKSVIELWSVLKSTSVEGLRLFFLQREGRLTEKEKPDAWRLLVQPHAHDVLIHHLPWTISIVRHPWMPAPLFVDWI